MRVCPLFAGVALLSLVLSPAAAYPQQSADATGGVAVGPTLLEVDVGPGEFWEGGFTIVAGNVAEPATFDLELMDLAQGAGGDKRSVERGAGVRSAAGWIEIVSEVTLGGGERREMPVVVRCPEGAFGCYSAFIVVGLRPKDVESDMAALVVPRIDVEVLVRVRSQGPLHLEVESMEFGTSESGTPQRLTLAVRNSGVWKTAVQGDILLYPRSGGFPERAQLPFRANGTPFELFPGQLIELECALEAHVPPGLYTALARLDLGEQRESRAEFVISVGADEQAGSATAAFGGRQELGTDLWVDENLFELTLPAGAVRSVPVRVRNLGERVIAIKATVEDARMESDGRWTFGNTGATVPGLIIAIAPDSLVVGPKRTATFTASVRLEKGARIESSVVKGVRLTGTAVGSSTEERWETVYDTGALIVVTPVARGVPEIGIAGLELVRVRPERNPGSAVLKITNSGGKTGHIKGTITLRRATGQHAATMSIGKGSWEPIVPGGRREFRMPLPLVDEGDFVIEAEVVQKDSPGFPVRAEATFTSIAAIPEGLR